jgi:hypothetical protein
MKNTSNRLLTTGLSIALGVGAAVSGVTLWTLMSQDVVHADSCGSQCGAGQPACDNNTCACGVSAGSQVCKTIVS